RWAEIRWRRPVRDALVETPWLRRPGGASRPGRYNGRVSASTEVRPMNKGVLYAAGAYVLWGLLPIFWKALQQVGTIEILGHRIVWGVLVALALLVWRGRWRHLAAALRDWRIVATYTATALLLTANWAVYIWGVNSGNIVETSLGYFINPLVNVVLGVLFL